MEIVELPPNSESIAGLKAHYEYQKRRQDVYITRQHTSWSMRKYYPEVAQALISIIKENANRAVRRYYGLK